MRILFIGTLICLCFAATSAQTVTNVALIKHIDALAAKTVGPQMAGLSVAVARNGKVIFDRGYGLANLEHSVPVTRQTVFHIASISKNILAAAVLQLAEQGKLKLDDDVAK